MATVAAIQAVLSPSLCASRSSTSSRHSDCRNGPQISAVVARPSLSLFCSPSSCASSSVAAAAGLSSSASFVSPRSVSKLRREVQRVRVRARDGFPGPGSGAASTSPRCESESNTDGKIPFGYTRKDVIGIGVGLLVFGVALKYGLEFFGVDSIKAGNAVQLIMVLGLTIGWISTYVFRVSSKDMTYAKQLKDYENKVMEKRLEEMPEAELESMLASIEEEKRILRENRDKLR